MRREGHVPSVLYGGTKDEAGKPQATPIAVSPKELSRILHSESGREHPHHAEARRRLAGASW